MRILLLSLLSTFLFTGPILAQDMIKPDRIGGIYIAGNTKTEMSMILNELHFYPGMVLDCDDLRAAEKRLAKLNRFVIDPQWGIRPHIEVRDSPNCPDSEFKDVWVIVHEKPERWPLHKNEHHRGHTSLSAASVPHSPGT